LDSTRGGGEDELLKAIMGKLNPKERPSLLGWHSWFATPPPQETSNVWKGDEAKVAGPLPDTMEVDGDSTESPKAAEQRLD
jgi:hypothetical protein